MVISVMHGIVTMVGDLLTALLPVQAIQITKAQNKEKPHKQTHTTTQTYTHTNARTSVHTNKHTHNKHK